MDIDEIRRTNIRALEQEAGSATVAAESVGMSYAQYVNLRDGAKDPRSGKRRGMRKETAWRFEDAFSKPRGWLDQDRSKPAPSAEIFTPAFGQTLGALPASIPLATPDPALQSPLVVAAMRLQRSSAVDEKTKAAATKILQSLLKTHSP